MQVFHTIKALTSYLEEKRNKQNTIGFIPTMGALHQGHLSLVRASSLDNDISVVSIFVNPIQFDNPDDLNKYPRNLDKDVALLEQIDHDIVVFAPSVNEFYNGNPISQHFDFDGLENEMEGKHRQGHFDGVGTVVKKLFEIVKPDKAYFGEKDFQQLQIIKKLVEKEKMPLTIVPVPIYREPDGLAMSSRNTRLTPQHRKAAPFIYQTLKQAQLLFSHFDIPVVKKFVTNIIDAHPLLELEYFEIAEEQYLKPANDKISGNKYRGFIVVYAGDIRLIDNIELS